MNRRAFVGAAGGGTAVALAGCFTRENSDEESEEPEDEGELRVATRPWMVRGDEPASEWLREEFEEANPDVELVWTVPEAGVELYVRQRQEEAELDADLYLGLAIPDLVDVDAALGGETRLFERFDRGRVERTDRLRDDLAFDDPDDRVLPFATDYLAVVYDGTRVDPPESFADLLGAEYEGSLLVPDPRTSRTGRSFLLWTVRAMGEDDAFDYWEELSGNVVLVENWLDAYRDVYADGTGSAIVGYSTAGVLANRNDWEPSRHRVAFFEGGSYETPEGIGIFAESPRTELAYAFADFVLSGEAQQAIAVRGGRHPAVEESSVELTDRFTEHARQPVESAAFTYDELTGRVDGWIEAWAEAIGA